MITIINTKVIQWLDLDKQLKQIAMRKLTVLISAAFVTMMVINACGSGDEKSQDTTTTATEETSTGDASSYDPNRGEGKFDEANVKLGALDVAMAEKGRTVANTKCFSCHKTTDEKLVGPGWKGVTTRRNPHWIMNFITNPDPMISKDPKVQADLELCLVRMPNQNLADAEAREILEFMRQNDGAK